MLAIFLTEILIISLVWYLYKEKKEPKQNGNIHQRLKDLLISNIDKLITIITYKKIEGSKGKQSEIITNQTKILLSKSGERCYGSEERKNRAIEAIKNNPGVLQLDLYKYGFDSSVFYWLEKEGYIRREKAGNNLKLFPADDLSKVESRNYLLRSWEERTKIPVETYPDSKERILKYFGIEKIKILFEYLSLDYNDFLFAIGEGLDLGMNDSLRKVIDKYCNNKEFEDKVRANYDKYGFFYDKYSLFYNSNNALENILDQEQRFNFYAELEQKADMFKIKCCGYDFKQVDNSRNIPTYYIKSLKFKWGLQPEICIKECVSCKGNFYPFYYAGIFLPYFQCSSQIFNWFPLEHSIKEVNFCPKCFPTVSYGKFLQEEAAGDLTIKERMKALLTSLVKILGFIPPKNFHKTLDYLKYCSREKFDEVTKIISSMPPLKKTLSSQPKGYEDIFGSWFQALEVAGILEGGVRKTARGYICMAKDGHECLSIGEKMVDDYLYEHNILHTKEPPYPGERRYRGDWLVGKYFIELWGFKGVEDYDKKIEEKRKILEKHQIPLIELTFSDIPRLNEKLNILLGNE